MSGLNKVYNSRNFFARNLTVIIAFLVPVIGLAISFIARSVYPFGDQMYMRSDMYHQYVTFLKEFQSILKNGDSLLHTWNIGLGSDLPGLYSYYLASPVNWIVAILPTTIVPEIMACFIIIKSGMMAATFTIYAQCRSKRRDFTAAAFGIFYALSSYMAAYSWNLMWIDCLLLLPLIILGLERLVKEKKVVLYTISLALAILSNYYIAIMICIYLVLYFFYLVLCEKQQKGFAQFASALGRFAMYSVISGLMAAMTVIPAFINILSTASAKVAFPKTLKFYFNILEMISHGIMNVEPTVLSGYIPNIYCTIGLFMMIPMYMLCKKIRMSEKIGKAVLMVIMLFSFSLNIPTYIWHGLHFPNSLSSRQSFIYIFLVLTMAYEMMIQIETFRYREITGCFVAGVMAIYALQVLYASEEYSMILVSISALTLALFFIWMMVRKSKKASEVLMTILLLVLCTAEAFINTNYTGYPTNSRTSYMQDNVPYSQMLARIEDNDFYRVEKVSRRTKNDAAWLNYHGASEFSSTTLAAVTKLYENLGMQGSTNSFSYYGHTPLTTMLLGVRYELADSEITDQLMTKVDEQNGYYLYENKYALPLAFMTDGSMLNVELANDNPFVSQNNIAQAANVEGLFNVQSTEKSEAVVLNIRENGRGFIYLTTKLESIKVTVSHSGSDTEKTYKDLENKQIVDIGDVSKGDKVTIISTDEDVKEISIYPAVMSYSKLEELYSNLSSSTMNITYYDDCSVIGKVAADKDGVLFTSIPDENGWEVYVDSKKVEVDSFKKALIAVPLTQGEHSIEFRYHSPGLGAAVLISIISICIFALLCIFNYRRKHPRRRRIEHFDNAGIQIVTEGLTDNSAAGNHTGLTQKIDALSGKVDQLSKRMDAEEEKTDEIRTVLNKLSEKGLD